MATRTERVRVDRQVAGLDRARDAQRARAVARPDRARQAVDRVVGEADRLGLVVERDHARRSARRSPRAATRASGPPGTAPSARTSSRGRRAPSPRIATGASSSRNEADGLALRRPRSAAPSASPRRAGRRRAIAVDRLLERARKSSSAARCTRIRERAQQSWPALPNTAPRRRRRGRLEVGVGEDDVGRLAAELERHALDRLRGARGDRAADLGRAGERDLGDVGVLDEPLRRTTLPGPTTTLTTPSGSPASSASSAKRSAVSGVSSAGLSTTVLPAASAGRELPRGDRQREVPRRDQRRRRRAARGTSSPRRRRPGSCRRAGARARRRSSGTCRRPCPSRRARRAIGLPALRASSCASSSCALLERVGEAVQQPRAVAGRDRPPRGQRGLGARDRRVGVLRAGARDLVEHRLRGGLEDRQQPSRVKLRGAVQATGGSRPTLADLVVELVRSCAAAR